MEPQENKGRDPLRWIPWLMFFVGVLPFVELAIRGSADNVDLGVAAVLLSVSFGSAWLYLKHLHWRRHA